MELHLELIEDRFVKLLTALNRDLRHRQDGQIHPESRLASVEPAEESAPDSIPPASRLPTGFEAEEEVPEPILFEAPKPPRKSIPVSPEELASLGVEPVSEEDSQSTLLPGDFYARDIVGGDSAMTVEEAEVALDTTLDPQEIGRILLAVLSQSFTRTCLLQATPSQIRGWLADGPGLDEERLRKYSISSAQPSIFLNLREGGSFFLGALPEMPAHLDLAACWHKDLSDESAVFPIRVQDRLVALVYGDRGPLGLADLDLDLIRGLCVSAARAFERCILDRKKKGPSAMSGESSSRYR